MPSSHLLKSEALRNIETFKQSLEGSEDYYF